MHVPDPSKYRQPGSHLRHCLFSLGRIPVNSTQSARTLLKNSWHGLRRAPIQEWTDMNCTVNSANNFSALSWIISRISPVQLALFSKEIYSRQAVYFSYTYEPFSAISGSATIFWVISYYRHPVYTPCTSHGEMIIHVLNSGIEVMGHDL